MGFYVIRHPGAGVGTCPVDALTIHRAAGWARVSEERPEPADFHLPDFADAPDLDAEPAPAAPAAKTTTKESKA
jgi:hypothetical protein